MGTSSMHQLWLDASDPRGPEAPSTPLLAGRTIELAAVRRHLEAGTGLLLVTGEAGIGKTTLVSAASAAADAVVSVGRCLPLSTEVPLLPVADALRSLVDGVGGGRLLPALARCPAYVASSLSRLLPEVAALTTVPDPDDAWSRQRLFQAVGAIVAAMGEDDRVALLIEDLHWADTATLDLLEHLLARGSGVPLVGTWRLDDPDTPAAHREWLHRIERSGAVTALDLGVLSRAETADLLGRVTGRHVDSAYVDRIYRRSVGQPLFTEQLASQGADDPLPRVLSDLLDRRIGALGPDAAAIVHVLGVGERALPDDVVMTVAGLQVTELGRGVRELSHRRLLTAQPREGQIQLGHPLFAEASRRQLAGVEGRDIHLRLALALAGQEDVSPGEVATHLQAAGDGRRELEWRIRAARAAEARFAGAQAAIHWGRALDLWPPEGADDRTASASRPDAYFGAMDGWDLAGWSTRGLALAERAMAECGDWETADRAEVLRKLAAYQTSGGDIEGDRLTAEAISLYRECPQTPVVVDRLAIALIHQSFTFSFRGRAADAARALDEARSLLAGLDPPSDRLHEVRAMIAWQHAVDGDEERALQELAEITDGGRGGPEPVRDVLVATHHSDVLLMAGRGADEVEAAAEQGLAVVRELGLDTYETNSLVANVVIAWIRAGRIARAAEVVDELTDSAMVLDRWILHLERMVLDLARGRWDEARERAGHLRAMDRISMDYMVGEQASLLIWTGEPEEALGLIVDVLACARPHRDARRDGAAPRAGCPRRRRPRSAGVARPGLAGAAAAGPARSCPPRPLRPGRRRGGQACGTAVGRRGGTAGRHGLA